ncbi:DUF5752 family protein [Candidatus Chloroploca asiatica]|uniref:AAA+ ATPase domain-containing protein n=1 Tax=Candidatus Chloroploca asiatica TaxID=1506545 RepID=A0A2H3KN78_9CHLR|nr:DUF5752 family protein [Candidatus Chloroploca asiatica]PDV98824.1 hypothetical protein A9Q02_02510 [Candidatus Chloroploca asiatica]
MHLSILASDLDGTLAEHGHVASATWQALRKAKQAQKTLILVTGRSLATFAPDGPFAEVFDAIVAENGAVIYLPRQDSVILPFGRLQQGLLERLLALPIPLEHGMALVATHVPHDQPIIEVLRECGGGASIEYNLGSVMVLPQGATKGTGLAFVLRELGLSLHNVVACGDAENDLSLLQASELAVAVANATPELKATADLVLDKPSGAGMRQLLGQLIDGTLPARPMRPERQLALGYQLGQQPFHLDPWHLVDRVWSIGGASGSGKSWLAGLLAEELIAQGYQVVVIDPEGDYRSLAALPHTMLVGSQNSHQQRVGDAITLCEYGNANLIVDLSSMEQEARNDYLERLLRELLDLRIRRSRPHWILLDEIQQSYPAWKSPYTGTVQALMAGGGVAMVSYRPSLIARPLLEAVQVWAITNTTTPEDLALFDELLGNTPNWAHTRMQIPALPRGHAYLADLGPTPMHGAASEHNIIFRTGLRRMPHIRHLHKYVTVPLPRNKWFVFRDETGTMHGTAANLAEFRLLIGRVPIATLEYHLYRNDFAYWLTDSLHDAELSRQMRKIVHRKVKGPGLRDELEAIIAARYDELATML